MKPTINVLVYEGLVLVVTRCEDAECFECHAHDVYEHVNGLMLVIRVEDDLNRLSGWWVVGVNKVPPPRARLHPRIPAHTRAHPRTHFTTTDAQTRTHKHGRTNTDAQTRT